MLSHGPHDLCDDGLGVCVWQQVDNCRYTVMAELHALFILVLVYSVGYETENVARCEFNFLRRRKVALRQVTEWKGCGRVPVILSACRMVMHDRALPA